MARFENVRPEAVVLCKTPADVSATIAFARRIGLQVAIRSGGDSAAGHSSTEGIVVDVTPMSTVSAKDGVATVGAGVRLGDLYDALQEHGLTIPAGCGHAVGIAGLTLGGGIGILGRKYGLTCDHLLRAQIVLADGRIVESDERQHGDLFWALRGAGGGNFGVVMSFVFRTVPALPATVFHLVWPLDHAAALVEAWQACAPTAHGGLDAALRLITPGDRERGPQVDLVGAAVGSEADAAEFIADLTARVGTEPAQAWRQQLPYREAKRCLDEIGSVGDQREIDFLPWGGAYNQVRPDATAFPHRDELFLVQHLLPRPGPRRLGARLLRRELRPPFAREGAVRPRELLPLPPIASRGMTDPKSGVTRNVARQSSTGVRSHRARTAAA
jgi:FAD binding domain